MSLKKKQLKGKAKGKEERGKSSVPREAAESSSETPPRSEEKEIPLQKS